MTAPATDVVPRGVRLRLWLRSRLRNIAPFATLLFLVIFFSFASPSFVTLVGAEPVDQQKLLAEEGELYVFAHSDDRVAKERAMRRRKLKWLWSRLKQIANMKLTRKEFLMKLGAARSKARAAWRPTTSCSKRRAPGTGARCRCRR